MEIMPGNPGQHRLTIFAVDEAGNSNEKSRWNSHVEKAMPEIIKEVMEGKKPLKESEAVNYGLIFSSVMLCGRNSNHKNPDNKVIIFEILCYNIIHVCI